MLQFHSSLDAAIKGRDVVIYVAPESHYKKKTAEKIFADKHWRLLKTVVQDTEIGARGGSFSSYTGEKNPERIVAAVLPNSVSRHNSMTRKEFIYQKTKELEGAENPVVIMGLDSADHYPAAAHAVARHLLYAKRKGKKKHRPTFHIIAVDAQGKVIPANDKVEEAAISTAWVCEIVDTPPSDLNPKTFAAEIKQLASSLSHVSVKEFVGEKLRNERLMGIYSVGKAAVEEPRMLVLDYKPRQAKRTFVLCGKGVTYDTGGLSLKISGAMVGMKGDMGGAAAVIGAFRTLVQTDFPERVVAVVGLVENAIGPTSFKNDDIITFHSGKTVEINNTDAEGRLVLADCVSYAVRNYKPEVVLDAATLTGAQMVSTGYLHAAFMTNDDALETTALQAGRDTGDMVCALPFAPEIFQEEFSSDLADMKNSVKNRMNAQSSCAAQFIYSHIDDCDVSWGHIDLAGPASSPKGLGTGYGVLLMSEILNRYAHSKGKTKRKNK